MLDQPRHPRPYLGRPALVDALPCTEGGLVGARRSASRLADQPVTGGPALVNQYS